MADTVAMAAGTLGILALAHYGREREAHWLLLAAAALAWALLTRLAYLLVALPAALYAGSLLLRDRGGCRRALPHALLALTVVAVVLGPALVTTVTDVRNEGRDFTAFAAAGEIYRWSPVTALRREHLTADGVLRYRLPNGLYYAAIPAHSFYLTPLLAPLILPGLWAVWQHRDARRLILLVGWPATVYLFHAGTAWQNVRFTLAYLPPLAILASTGFATMLAGRKGGWRGLLAVYLAAGLLWLGAGAVTLTRDFIARMQGLAEAIHQVEARVPPGARVITFGLTQTFEHESELEVYELYVLSPAEMSNLLRDERSLFLYLDTHNVEEQWRDRAPGENYQWLREGPGLEAVAQWGAYTLFRVGGP
jgi:4-amino-4-deoxy-L-arabinose transferase-like glycosyltransferase